MNSVLINKIKDSFILKFKTKPLIIFSPGRINIIGEHTDYNEGFVFPAAIDKGIYTAISKSDTGESTAYALDLSEFYSFSTKDSTIQNLGNWKSYLVGVIEEIKKTGKEIPEFNIVFSGDIPEGAGLSSSAALENSIAFGLNELFKLNISKKEMILISQKAEHKYVGVNCGIMDQYASMFGIKDKALLLDCRSITSEPFTINLKDYELLLINTNVKHKLSESAYNNRRKICENVADMLNIQSLRDADQDSLNAIKSKLSEEDYQKVLYVVQENIRVKKASIALKNNDLHSFGILLYETHLGLKDQYQVSCAELDFLVDMAKENQGVIGARMMGGGFGGCTINIVKKENTDFFTKQTSRAYLKKFNKECSIYYVNLVDGTHLILS